MADASSSRKQAKTVDANRFNALPNELLTHIISFLPFKEAVRSSCLGTRWRRRWLDLRKIILDEAHFTMKDKRRLLEKAGRNFLANGLLFTGRQNFVDLVNWFLEHYTQSEVESICLAFSNPIDFQKEVRVWLRTFASWKVECLELNFSDPEELGHDDVFENHGRFDLPEEAYELGTFIKTLKLTACNVKPDRMGSLHALRVLSLSRVVLARNGVEILTSSCPLLEELYLDHLGNTGEVAINSASTRLHVLSITDCDPVVYGVRIVGVPELRFFKYRGYTGVFDLQQLDVLEEVELIFPGEDALDACELLRDLLESLKTVKKLTVCTNLLQVTPFGEDTWRLPSSLDRVRELTLYGVMLHKDEIQGIGLLLRSCPYLESLTIVLDTREGRPSLWRVLIAQEPALPCGHSLDSAGSWEDQLLVPMPGLMYGLQNVTVDGFNGEAGQSNCIRVILKTAMSLLRLNILISKRPSTFGQIDMEFRYKEARKLLRVERASPDVKITIETRGDEAE